MYPSWKYENGPSTNLSMLDCCTKPENKAKALSVVIHDKN